MRTINRLYFLFLTLFFLLSSVSLKAQIPKLMLPIGHTDYIKSLKISPDEKRVVTVGIDKKTILWDLETGFRLADLDNNNKAIDGIVFNEANTRILAVQKYESEKSIPLWSAVTGALIARLAHKAQIADEAFSRDGKEIITVGHDELIKIWDAQTGKITDSINNGDLMFNAKFSNDGKKLIVGGGGSVKVYDYTSRKLQFELQGHTSIVSGACFSPDDNKILTCSYDKTAKIWDAKNGQLLYTLNLDGNVTKAEYNSNGTAIVTEVNNISDKNLKLWDARTGKLIKTLTSSKEEPRFATFSHNGALLATGTQEADVKIWDSENGNLIYTLKEHYSGARVVKFTNDDATLIVAASTPSVKIWDLKSGQLIESLKMLDYGAVDIDISRSNAKLVIPTNRMATVWDFARRAKLVELKGQGADAVQEISFSKDQKLMVTDNRIGTFTRIWDMQNGDMLSGSMYAQNDIERIVYSNSHQKAMVKYKDSKTIEIWNIQNGSLISTLNKANCSYEGRWAFSADDTKLVTWSTAKDKITIWDIISGNVLRTIERQSKVSINHLFLTPDDKKIIGIDIESNATIWDLETGNEMATIAQMNERAFHNFKFIGTKNWLLTSSDKASKIWNMDNGKLVMNLTGLNKSIRSSFLSPDEKTLITQSFFDTTIKIWNTDSKKQVANLEGKATVGTLTISTDWKYVVSTSFLERPLRIWDIMTGELITAINPHEINASAVVLSKDGKYMFTYGGDQTIRKWEFPAGKLIQGYKGLTAFIRTLVYNEEKKQVLAGSSNGDLILWDAETGAIVKTFSGHTGAINIAIFGPKPNTVISASDDLTLKTWNVVTGKTMNTFFPVGTADFLNQVDHGYYKSSPGASKLLHYVSNDLKPITFDQLDLKYNRPDKVLRQMGSADTTLINAYYKAYLKRIKKLGIDTSAFTTGFNLPTIDFVNRKDLAFNQKGNSVKLHIKGADSILLIDRFNIWVNENPILGSKGINLKARKTKTIDTLIEIKLNDGDNKIETSITNVNGNESYRTPLYLNYSPEKPSQQKFYFIGIGINDFEQKQNNLTWSVKDIRDLAAAFKLKYGDNAVINLLMDQEVTLQNVMALKEKLKDCTVNDKVIIAYSGHGLLDKNYDYFLSTYNINFEKPAQNGLPYDAFESLIADIPARKKLMLIDACHSGEVDKDELLKINNASQNLEVGKIQGGKGVKVLNTAKKDGMKTSLELMQQLFVNVSRSTGSTIISAAAGTQFALEKNDLQNGVFSYSILEYMKANPHATVTDLKKYVNKRVVELTAGLQVPTTRNETNIVDWQVW